MNTEEEIYDQSFQENAESGVSIWETIFKYLKHWPWFLLSLAVFMVAGYFYVKSQIPQYRIQGQILISDNKQSADQVVLDALNISPPNVVIDNEILIIKSNTLIEKVVKDLSLQYSYFVKGPLKKRILYKNQPVTIELIRKNSKSYSKAWSVQLLKNNEVLFEGKKISLNTPVITEAGTIVAKLSPSSGMKEVYYVTFSTVESVAQDYLNKLTVAPVNKQSNIVNLITEDAVPRRGQDFLDKVVERYIEASLNYKTQNIANTIKFINDRLKELAVELNTENRNVQNFKSANNVTDLGTQSQTILTKISANDAQLAEAELQLVILRNIEGFLASPDNVQVSQPSLLGMPDATLASQVSQLGDLKLKKQALVGTIRETNPVLSSINDQILSLKNSIAQTVRTVRSNLTVTLRELKQQSAGYEAQLKGIPVKERELLDVMRNQGVKNTLFTFLLQKREETQLSLASNTADSRIINPARSSGAPIKPIVSTLYMIFFSLGLGIPFAVIFTREMLNSNIQRKSDISKITRVPIIAQISHAEDMSSLTIISKPRSIVAEQIRALRTNLDFLIPGSGSKTILFTSTVSGEGKSYISLNLGASLASTGKKVIILELDLRKPKLLTTIGLDKKTGLSDYLIGKVDYRDIIRAVPQQENFYMIESGTIPPNPAEILMNTHLPELITALRKDYDYILIDAPPIGLVTDAQILSQYADVTFYLVRHNFTRKEHMNLLNEIQKKKIFKNLNIVFNSIDASGFGYGYRYDYSYYGESEPKSKSWLNSITNKFTKK
jgi:tyrosine-protein kinase Etk/Wzc